MIIKSIKLTNSTQLATPTIESGQGFTSSNPYLLTFNMVPNAIGYVVYLKPSSSSEYSKFQPFTQLTQ